MKKVILFLAFVLCMSFVLAQSATGGTTTLGQVKIDNTTYYTPYPAEPGQYVDLWVRVQQSGTSYAAEGVQCEMLPKFPFSLEPGESALSNVGTLTTNQVVILKYRLRVDVNALEGDNEVDFQCMADGLPWQKTTFQIYVQTHDAILDVTNITSSPAELLSGQSGKITVAVKNLANAVLKDVSIALDMSSSTIPFSPVNGTTQRTIKQMSAGEIQEVSFSFVTSPDAAVGVYKIPLSVTYSDFLGKSYTKQMTISLSVTSKPNLFIGLESTEITKNGMKGRFTATVANRGISAIKFVAVKLLPSESYTILSPAEKYVGNLNSDSTESIDFDVYVNSDSTLVEFPVEVSYYDANNREYTESKLLQVRLFSQQERLTLGLEQVKGIDSWILLVGGVIVLYILYRIFKFFTAKKHG
jgi:hypothetical protein